MSEHYWDIFNETNDKLIRIEGRKMSLSWDGGETFEKSLTFASVEKAGRFAQMMIDILNCKRIKAN